MNAFDYPEEPTTFASLASIASGADVVDETAGETTGETAGDATSNASSQGSIEKQRTARCQVLHVGTAIGSLCAYMNTYAPLDPLRPKCPTPKEASKGDDEVFPVTLADHPFWSDERSPPERDAIYNSIGVVFASIILLSDLCDIDLRTSILKKIELNRTKYPVDLCKGRSGKYTVYSDETGVTESNQSLTDIDVFNNEAISDQTVKGVQKIIQDFAVERKWERYHTPRNILLAMMGEVGELAELFQWRGDDVADYKDANNKGLNWKEEDIDHLQQEIADVAIYCLRLADVVGIKDLGFIASVAMQYDDEDEGENGGTYDEDLEGSVGDM